MKAKITTLSILVLGLFWAFSLVAQPPTPITIKVDTVVTCPGPGVYVYIPILIKNWVVDDSIPAFNFVLKYDTTALRFDTAINIDSIINAQGLFVQGANADQWAASWFSLSIVAPLTDTLIVLKFEYLQNWSAMTWDLSQSNFYDDSLYIFPTIWDNGLVALTGPFIQTQPINTTAPAGTNTQFSVAGKNITAYQWQSSIDGINFTDLTNGGFYSNVTLATLDLTLVNPTIDGTYYRVKATGPCGIQYSTAGKLLVVSTTPIMTYVGTTTYCAGTITVPILVSDFYDVEDFTLKINYNTGTTNILTYSNYQGFNISGGSLTITPSPQSLLIHFQGSGASNFGNDTLIQLVFGAAIGTTGFNWDLSTSQYLTPAGSPHFVNFVNANLTINSFPTSPGMPSGPNAICSSTLPATYTVLLNPTFVGYIWSLSDPAAGTLIINNNSVQITFDPTFTGTVTLLIQGVNNCGTGPIFGKIITVHIPTPLTITPMASVCVHADPVTLTIGTPPGGTYSGSGVYNGTFIADSIGIGTTTITYTFTNSYNCTSTISTPVTVNALPTVTFTIPYPVGVCYNWSSFYMSGGVPAGGTYSGPGVNAAGIFTPGVILIGNQNITYTVTGANGCKNSAVAVLHVDGCNNVDNQNENMTVSIQPNPNHGLFEINVTNLKEEASLAIYNDLGQQVYSEKLSPAVGTNLKLDLSNQPSGMYFLMLNCNGNIQVDKIILK